MSSHPKTDKLYSADKLRALLHHLSDGQYHSGETLGQKLGLTRSGVWKLIQQCRELDISLTSSTNKGYRLEHPLTLLDRDKILAFLQPAFLPEISGIEIFDTLPSTNDYLLAKAQTHPSGNWVCLAEHQSLGKGRKGGRNWISPFAKNLYFSLLWRFSMDVSVLTGLSLVTAIAIIKTLKHYAMKELEININLEDLGIKWPNDIFWQFKKLAGVLIEVTAEAHAPVNTVIGIGLNIDMSSNAGKNISQPWVSLAQILNYPIDRNAFVGQLLNHLIEAFALFSTAGLEPFMGSWREYDLTMKRQLSITTPVAILQGTGLGINPTGHLLVEMPNKKIQSFASGEVSLHIHA